MGILCRFNELKKSLGGHHWTSWVKKGQKNTGYWQHTGNSRPWSSAEAMPRVQTRCNACHKETEIIGAAAFRSFIRLGQGSFYVCFRASLNRDPLDPILVGVHKHPEGVLPRFKFQRHRSFSYVRIVNIDLGSAWIGCKGNRTDILGRARADCLRDLCCRRILLRLRQVPGRAFILGR